MKLRNSLMVGFLTLGCGAAVWGIDAVTTPNSVQAYTTRLDVTLDRRPNETYDSLVRRAEVVARAAIQRGFDRDLLANEVSVVIVGRNGGMASPVVSVWVTRSQWQSRPDAKRWATYYRGSKSLLGF
ncbi:MAG: hypothetical protein MUC48_02000 [Leptolyngbya sp. Prado105]|nr:hypothetical protein [Leptolyngbya sp. Prado105]